MKNSTAYSVVDYLKRIILKNSTAYSVVDYLKRIKPLYSAYRKGYNWKWKRSVKGTIRSVQSYRSSKTGDFPLFDFVEIETQNRCNGTCGFCPVNSKVDPRPFSKMDEALFDNIISQLKDLNYSGFLALFSNNEPFLDKRLYDFVEKAKKTLVNAKIFLISNGSNISPDRLDKIMPFLDKLCINDYSATGRPTAKILELKDHCSKQDYYNGKVSFDLRNSNEVLSSRGGNAPNKDDIKLPSMSCILPFVQLVIRPDGKISLCCNDALGQVTLGDLKNESIIDIWSGKMLKEIRQDLYLQGRKSHFLCKNCDTVSTHLNFYNKNGTFDNDIKNLI